MPKAPQAPTEEQANTETPTEPTESPSEGTEDTPEAENTPEPAKAQGTPRKAPARPTKTTTPNRAQSLFTSLDEAPEFHRVVVYGREGSGKTTSACFLANLGKILVINAEGGLRKGALRRLGVNTDNIYIWQPSDDQPLTHANLEAVYRKIAADLADDPNSWTGVILDSATEITEALVSHIAGVRLKNIRERGTVLDEIDEFQTDRNDYGVMSKMFRDLLRKFRDLPCHLVVTALERRDVDEDTGRVAYGPATSPALMTDLLGYVDVALYMRAQDEDGPFRAISRKRGPYRAKDRTGMLPALIANPTMDRIVAYLEGDLTEDNDEQQRLLPVKNTDPEKRDKGNKKAKS